MSTLELRKEIKDCIDKADERTLKIIYAMLEANDNDFEDWNAVPEALRQSIEEGLQQADEGKLIPHEEARKKYAKWLSK